MMKRPKTARRTSAKAKSTCVYCLKKQAPRALSVKILAWCPITFVRAYSHSGSQDSRSPNGKCATEESFRDMNTKSSPLRPMPRMITSRFGLYGKKQLNAKQTPQTNRDSIWQRSLFSQVSIQMFKAL